MVKKKNLNNIRVVFQGDDLEPQETVENYSDEDKKDDDESGSDKADDSGGS